MPIVTTRSVVLQTFRYSDTSKILRLLTLEHGPVSVIARGALRPRSRMSGLLEPFAEGEATIYLKANRDLHTLSGFDLIRERQSLGLDLARFAGASVLSELVMRVAPRETDPSLYAFHAGALDRLVAAPLDAVEGTAAALVWQLVQLLGFAPAVEACVDCGRPPEEDVPGRFDLAAGGLRCHRCPRIGRHLPAAEVEALRRLARGDASVRPSPLQLGLLTEFIRWHAAEGARIRSLDFFAHPAAQGSGRR